MNHNRQYCGCSWQQNSKLIKLASLLQRALWMVFKSNKTVIPWWPLKNVVRLSRLLFLSLCLSGAGVTFLNCGQILSHECVPAVHIAFTPSYLWRRSDRNVSLTAYTVYVVWQIGKHSNHNAFCEHELVISLSWWHILKTARRGLSEAYYGGAFTPEV